MLKMPCLEYLWISAIDEEPFPKLNVGSNHSEEMESTDVA
jgi:hypothetical protein